MNDRNEDFDKKLEKLREIHLEHPREAEAKLNTALNQLDNETISKDRRKKFLTIFCVICGLTVLLVGLISKELIPMYYFGLVFFIAGLCVGLFQQGFGLVFLFSHGGTGLGLMLVPRVMSVFDKPYMSDNPPQNTTRYGL